MAATASATIGRSPRRQLVGTIVDYRPFYTRVGEGKRMRVNLDFIGAVVAEYLVAQTVGNCDDQREVSDTLRDLCILNTELLLGAARCIDHVDAEICFDDQIVCVSAMRLIRLREGQDAADRFAAKIQAKTMGGRFRPCAAIVLRCWRYKCHSCGMRSTDDGYEDGPDPDLYDGDMPYAFRLRDHHCPECAYNPRINKYRLTHRMERVLFDEGVREAALAEAVITGRAYSLQLQSLVDAYNRKLQRLGSPAPRLRNTASLRHAIDDADNRSDAEWHERGWPVPGHTADGYPWLQAIDAICCAVFQDMGPWGYARFFDD